jgi:zinc transport system substrate-binding protein
MQGVAEPELLVPGGASPHNFSLRPSQVRAMQRADLLIWVGPEMETFLARSLASEQLSGRILTLADRPELNWLAVRSAGLLKSSAGHAEADEHQHGHAGSRDYHFWLSPTRSMLMAEIVCQELIRTDPTHAGQYQANLNKLKQLLAELKESLQHQLEAVKGRPYLVFHDAYRYFEEEFQISPRGVISVNPERPPGARRVNQIRQELIKGEIRCLFSEPQFEPRLIQVLLEGIDARPGILDPIGAGLEPGPGAYQVLLRTLAENLIVCLE